MEGKRGRRVQKRQRLRQEAQHHAVFNLDVTIRIWGVCRRSRPGWGFSHRVGSGDGVIWEE
jgi:hypothetical protein